MPGKVALLHQLGRKVVPVTDWGQVVYLLREVKPTEFGGGKYGALEQIQQGQHISQKQVKLIVNKTHKPTQRLIG
jgi:hypothetical protein